MAHKLKLLVVQPGLLHYRIKVYDALAKLMSVCVVAPSNGDSSKSDFQFVHSRVFTLPLGLKWQSGVVSVFSIRRYDAMWIAADANYLSSVFLSILSKLLRIKVLIHGQGLFKKGKNPIFRKLCLKFWFLFIDKYVTYGPVSTLSMIEGGFPNKKLATIYNRFETLELNGRSVSNSERKGLLFIGRPRDGSGLNDLISIMSDLNQSSEDPIQLHVIGGYLEGEKYEWLREYGEVTDPRKLEEISNLCNVGIYPGRAGLSVLTYMGLGLPVLVGDRLDLHMGPEPAYVIENINGWKFCSGDLSSLRKTILLAINDPLITHKSKAALEFYRNIHSENYSQSMYDIILEVIEKQNES